MCEERHDRDYTGLLLPLTPIANPIRQSALELRQAAAPFGITLNYMVYSGTLPISHSIVLTSGITPSSRSIRNYLELHGIFWHSAK